LTEAYGYFVNGELYVKGMHVSEYEWALTANHEPKRDRKAFLLTKKELRKLFPQISGKRAYPIIAYRLFVNEKRARQTF